MHARGLPSRAISIANSTLSPFAISVIWAWSKAALCTKTVGLVAIRLDKSEESEFVPMANSSANSLSHYFLDYLINA